MKSLEKSAVANRAYWGEDARLETAPTGDAGDRPPRYGRRATWTMSNLMRNEKEDLK